MKNLVIVLLALFAIPFMSFAQTSDLDAFFDKYAGMEGFTTVVVTQKMFELFGRLDLEDDDDLGDMADIIGDIKGLKVLVFEDAEDPAQMKQYFTEVSRDIPSKRYEDLMMVRGEDENVDFKIKEDANGIIEELLMVVQGEDEFVFLSLYGKIDLAKVSKLARTMDIDGLEHLQELDED